MNFGRVLIAGSILLISSAWACCAPMSREEIAQKSQLIVIGKLSERKEIDQTWASATLTIQETVKGDASLKTVILKFLAKPGNTATWTYSGNEQGLWCLTKDSADGVERWMTFHPNCYLRNDFPDETSRKEVDAVIAEVRQIAQREKELQSLVPGKK